MGGGSSRCRCQSTENYVYPLNFTPHVPATYINIAYRMQRWLICALFSTYLKQRFRLQIYILITQEKLALMLVLSLAQQVTKFFLGFQFGLILIFRK